MANDSIDSRVRKFEWMLNACCVSIAVIILGLFLGLLTKPLLSSTIEFNKQSHALTQFLKGRRKIELQHDDLISKFIELDKRREDIMARIPDDPHESVFLSQISQAAENCGLTVQEFRPGTPKRNERFSEMEVEVSSQGTYESLCRFLDLIEDLPRYTLVSDIDLDTGGSQNIFPVQMKLRIFFNESNTQANWRPTSVNRETL